MASNVATDMPEGAGRGALTLYLVSAILASIAVAFSSSGNTDPRQPRPISPRADQLADAPEDESGCRACEDRKSFRADPFASNDLNAGRLLLHDLSELEDWTLDEAGVVSAIFLDPRGRYPALGEREPRWLACVAIKLAGERLRSDSIHRDAANELVGALESILFATDASVRFQVIDGLKRLPMSRRTIPNGQIQVAMTELRDAFDPRLLAPLDRRVGERRDVP